MKNRSHPEPRREDPSTALRQRFDRKQDGDMIEARHVRALRSSRERNGNNNIADILSESAEARLSGSLQVHDLFQV